MAKVAMILETLRSFRAFHIKIAIGHLDQKRVRIYTRGSTLKRFNMIIKQALIFILARDQMRNTADIHRLSKVVGNPQRMRR